MHINRHETLAIYEAYGDNSFLAIGPTFIWCLDGYAFEDQRTEEEVNAMFFKVRFSFSFIVLKFQNVVPLLKN